MTDRWYAVHCKPREEHKADAMLRAKGYRTFFPHTTEWIEASKRKARLEHRAYLSRYIFVCFQSERTHIESAYDVNETPGVSTMVYSGTDRNGDRAAFPIPLDVMDEMRRLTDKNGRIHQDKKKAKGVAYGIGDRVVFVERNPLSGLMGVIEDVLGESGKRILVRLDRAIAGSSVMEIGESNLREVRKAI
jgi:transcription antitermination factor NusG